MKLVWPSREYLASYVDALERGWSPDNIRGYATAALREIVKDAGDQGLRFVHSERCASTDIECPRICEPRNAPDHQENRGRNPHEEMFSRASRVAAETQRR